MQSKLLKRGPALSGKVCDLDLYRKDKEAAETAVRVAVSTLRIETFVAMLDTLRAVMLRYGKSRMEFRDFTVTMSKNGIPLIKGKKTAAKCPGCGSKEGWMYLQTVIEGKPRSQDLVAWGCRNCGTVFNRWEVNWDDAS